MNKYLIAKAVAESLCDDMDIDALAAFFVKRQTDYLLDDKSEEELIDLATTLGIDIYEI